MPKKFNAENVNTEKQETGADTGAASEIIEKGKKRTGQQATASKEEQEKRKIKFQTQGRKGCKMPRFNLSISPANQEYVKVMAGVTGQSISLFVNSVIDKHREENAETYAAARAIIDQLNGGADDGQ